MITFSVSISIDSPVDIVNMVLMNPDNFPFWQKDLERFEVIKGKPGEAEAGNTALLHYSQKGKKFIMEDRMIYCEPGKKYISEVSRDFLTARVETDLVSSDGKTGVTITWSGKGRILILKILLPFLKGKMIKQSKAELETFKHLVETKGSNFS